MSVHEATPVPLAVPAVDQVLDLYGDPAHHDLALFMHGNQWMVLPDLLRAFRAEQPDIGSIYYETLPPGILVQQVQQGALRLGELLIRVEPDVLTADVGTLARLAEEGWLRDYHEYAANTLALLVRGGNPLHIRGWADLLCADVRVALPNPETEEIGRLVRDAINSLLGADAWTELAVEKRARGEAIFTQIHHRETPHYLLMGRAEAGPVWLSEGLHQERLGIALDTVRLPAEQNRRGRYGVAVVERTSPHPEAAEAFVAFLRGSRGRAVYAEYGFEVGEAERV